MTPPASSIRSHENLSFINNLLIVKENGIYLETENGII